VISCEGACIRGEIARLAAHLVAKEEPYRRSCHGEMFTVPTSAIAQWMNDAGKVVVIDGCFLHCHGRILSNLALKAAPLSGHYYSLGLGYKILKEKKA
jgi:uncharacterized metal-binding protein